MVPARFGWTAAGLLVVIAFGIRARAQEPAAPPAQPPVPASTMTIAPGPGADVFESVCVKCHPPDRIVVIHRTRIEWDEVLDKMITRGAQVTDDNYGTLEDYLLRNYGKININKAPKDDIALVLGTTPAQADAIVKFRAANGPFADFAAVTKVPGLDAKKLETKRESITF
jgi:competence protein ComEA